MRKKFVVFFNSIFTHNKSDNEQNVTVLASKLASNVTGRY